MQLEDWLDDLCVRFIVNLPREELESVERICFQVEEAQWFYEDFIRPLDPALPSLSLKAFALRIFQHCPLMSQWSHYHHMTAFSEFLAYKTRVPVRGAILLNQEMDEVVLVKGWKKGANWSFPRGKINKGEKDLDCAIREVYEETGFDVREANLVQNEDDVKHIEITMREQHMRLYVFRGVPRDTHFEPRTRKEISRIDWYKLSDLPTLKKNKNDEGLAVANANKFYMVAPFLHPLKRWIAQQKRLSAKAHAGTKPYAQAEGYVSMEENGYQTNGTSALQSTATLAIPSDLPEVTSVQDASSQLKQLLKIGGGAPVPAQPPVQPTVVDQSKSNALLELLRKGSQEIVPPSGDRSGAPSSTRPAHLAPNFFPGFPQQQQHLAPSNFMQQTSAKLPTGLLQSVAQPSVNVNSRSLFPPMEHPELSASPAIPNVPHMAAPNYHNAQAISQSAISATPRHGPAPFQQTGDPQFSHQTGPSQLSGATVPPASKLPPPKLTSHSLALLNFFKNDTSKTPEGIQAATLAAPAQGPNQIRKTSQHQDSLLNLFGVPRSTPSSQPAELSGNPVPQAPEIQILQRPQQQASHNMQRGTNDFKAGQTAATVSGPLHMPQFEAIPKTTHRKATNGSSRRHNSSRREPSQQLSSPITILPRPQSAKRHASLADSNVQATQPSDSLHDTQTAAPEPVKPFQPQILRRSEKPSYENMLMEIPKTENGDRKPSLPGLQMQPNDFARRPSQTATQKEALLSLFGKPATSSSPAPAEQLDSRAVNANQPPINASGLVSPLSSLHFPSSGESLSRHGTPSEVDRVASPSNKAFLLGYLQGVAKGNK
ncbi:uncharacterized protein N7459_003159 [Penicillium hispanicum]|uniref:uncharacterized protein n=1 Tax=Penicillium hispanicum TaxID=1080232 RepID=UPI00254048F6|nr:uncharacterized protein N7459_003159 [Penicillium hispanicum]KAJ5587394.1 hypothetical protein N7459_003159 [Penicillium hispanicum]